jgi:hypothetical protein
MAKTGIAVGLNKGHVTTRRELPQRASRRKGVGFPLLLGFGVDL